MRSPTLEADRLGNVSAFVAVASQLILIKSRAMLPRPPVGDRRRRPTRRPIPRRSCGRGCSSTGPIATPGRRLADDALERVGLFRREPSVARARPGLAGARPVDAPPIDPARLVDALDRLVG